MIDRWVATIRHLGDTIAIQLDGEAAARRVDILYPALGAAPRTERARSWASSRKPTAGWPPPLSPSRSSLGSLRRAMC